MKTPFKMFVVSDIIVVNKTFVGIYEEGQIYQFKAEDGAGLAWGELGSCIDLCEGIVQKDFMDLRRCAEDLKTIKQFMMGFYKLSFGAEDEPLLFEYCKAFEIFYDEMVQKYFQL